MDDAKKAEINATEDLMREHGLLNQCLLIYEAQLAGKLNLKIIYKTAVIIRQFVEDYHEKLEEKYIFPLVQKSGKHTQLIDDLLFQHQVGRKLTEQILLECRLPRPNIDLIAYNMKVFIHMYRAHETREDTIIFPEIHNLLDKEEFNKLSRLFDKIEDEIFGENGFEKILSRVEIIEKELGIYNLQVYTPIVYY
jgi:hemerythrin-like domain-containing protein